MDQRPAIAAALRRLNSGESTSEWVTLGNMRYRIELDADCDMAYPPGQHFLWADKGKYKVNLFVNKDGLRVDPGYPPGRKVQWTKIRAVVREMHQR